ncbi:unnamed protein product [Protopolystoma xenopodis]|uniref:Uncharacterized protein n=1 Tax=Protopolystoma xenopodis TaxID=117903 RepID=A0A3S5AZC1_9PLAT|nr:unnamed protein product [Protopolystoma xenopodis]
MFLSHKRCTLLANLPWRHHTCCIHSSPPFRLADHALVSCPDLPHGPVDPILIFPVDRFHSVTAAVYFTPDAISQGFCSTYKVTLSSDSHAWVMSSIKPVYPEQTGRLLHLKLIISPFGYNSKFL